MSSYQTSLKTWGSTGSEYPNGYNYVEGEQPVDAWDNFFNANVITDIENILSIVNDRQESDVGTAFPSSPEDGHLTYRTDEEAFYVYDSTNATWHRLLQADGDSMGGALDMAGYSIQDSTANPLNVAGDADVTGSLSANSASLDHEWFSKQEGGTVAAGQAVPIGTFGLADGETLAVTQAMLTKDGFNTACVSGVDLIIRAGGSATTTTILSGDGATLFDDETGSPLASYTNTTGAAETVMIALDNGQYNTGSGSDVSAYGGYIARTY